MPVFWLLVLAGAFLFFRKKRKAGKIVLIVAGCWLLLVSTPFIPKMGVKLLESSYAVLKEPGRMLLSDTLNIIILGGGHTSDSNLPANNQLSSNALGRLCEGIRLHRLLPGGRLVLSGSGAKGQQSQAKVLYTAALGLGVPAEDMDTLSKSRRTEEEAEYYLQAFGSKRKVIVVTDAFHMPRAMRCFAKQGLSAIAAPTNHIYKTAAGPTRIVNYFPSGGNISKMEMCVHEIVGMMVMK